MPVFALLPLMYEIELCGWPLFLGIAILAMLGFWAESCRLSAEARRYRAIHELAAKHNLKFMGDLPCAKPDAPQFTLGDRQATQNTILANIQNRELQMGDFNYQRVTHDKDGHRHVTHFYFSYCFVPLPQTAFPDLAIRPELPFDKLLATLGFEDINFESHEFSRKFHVQSKHRKFAYDLITPRIMEHLLQHPQYGVQCCRAGLVVLFAAGRRCAVAEFLPAAYFAVSLVDSIPAHLWDAYRLPAPDSTPENPAATPSP